MKNRKIKLDLRDALRRLNRCIARISVLVAASGLMCFAQVFLPHLITDAPAPFHHALCVELETAMQGGARLIGALPREHAKTTLGTVALVLREAVGARFQPFHPSVGGSLAAGSKHGDQEGGRTASPTGEGRAALPKRNILIVGANLREARGKLRQIVHELESNSLLRLAFGKRCAPARDNQGRITAYADGEIVLAGGARISCIGFGGKVRGQIERGKRLDLVVLDDPEDDASTASSQQRERLRRWVFSALLNALDVKAGSLVWLGTLLHHDSVLAQALAQHSGSASVPLASASRQSSVVCLAAGRPQADEDGGRTAAPTGGSNWRTIRYSALNDVGDPLWPARWTYERLMARRAEIGERAFAQEYMNQPQSLSEQVFFDERWRVYNPAGLALNEQRWKLDGRPLAIAIGVDPAIGQQREHDYFAAVAVGMLEGSGGTVAASYSSPSADVAHNGSARYSSPLQAYVLEVRRFKRPFAQQIDSIRELAQRWLPQVIGIESVSYQAALKQAAFDQGLPVKELRGTQAKAARIETLAAQVERGSVLLPVHGAWVARLREEAAQYPSGKHDDQLDALAYALECGISLLGTGPLDVYASEREEARGL